jgi:EH domain-containing protein 1
MMPPTLATPPSADADAGAGAGAATGAAGAGADPTQTSESYSTKRMAELASNVFDKEYFFQELKRLYKRTMLPLELDSRYAHFHSPPLSPDDFDSKPMVLLLGQYSVGKTSFIRSLLHRDFPGQRIGPEPTTDRFVAVMHGDEDRVVPGHALAGQRGKPFRGLQPFGNSFLTKFQGAELNSPILQNLTLVDTPGVLSGENQRIGRGYEFPTVVKW